jgi:hypothetical protein
VDALILRRDIVPRAYDLRRGTPSRGCRSLVAKVWHRVEMSESSEMWTSQQKCSAPISIASFPRQSGILLASRFTWEGMILRWGWRRQVKSSSNPESHQIGDIFEGWLP